MALRLNPTGYIRSDNQLGSWISNLVHKVTGSKTGAQKKAEAQFVEDAVTQLSQTGVSPATSPLASLTGTTDNNLLLYGGLGLAAVLLLKRKKRR